MQTYQIWYFRAEYMTFGGDFGVVDTANLGKTHVLLKEIQATSLADVFARMQGGRWSPLGEARDLIRSKGLHHTSMSMGDIAVDSKGSIWLVKSVGWEKIGSTHGSQAGQSQGTGA